MSLEAALAELNKSIQTLIDIEQQKLSSIAKLGEKAGVEKKEKVSKKDDAEDAEEAPAPKSKKTEEKPAKTEKKASVDKKSAKSEITDKDIRKAFGDFMNFGDEEDPDDVEVRDEREDFVLAMFDHLGVKTAIAIEQEDRKAALYWLDRKAKGKKVDFEVHLPPQDEEDEE